MRGNHEELLLDSFNSIYDMKAWQNNGAVSTLNSFGINSIEELDEKYLKFFKELKYFIILEKYVLVHAHLNFFTKTPFDDKFTMLWSRDTKVYSEKINDRKIICGHTPKSIPDIISSLNTNKIFLDGGCVHKFTKPNMGYLCALDLNKFQLYYTPNIDF